LAVLDRVVELGAGPTAADPFGVQSGLDVLAGLIDDWKAANDACNDVMPPMGCPPTGGAAGNGGSYGLGDDLEAINPGGAGLLPSWSIYHLAMGDITNLLTLLSTTDDDWVDWGPDWIPLLEAFDCEDDQRSVESTAVAAPGIACQAIKEAIKKAEAERVMMMME